MIPIIRFFVVLGLFAALLSSSAVVAGGLPPAPVCGDVNLSTTVTSGDALLVLKSAVGQPVSLNCGTCPSVGIYGIDNELPLNSLHSEGILLGSALKIPVSATLTHLSVIAKSGGPRVKMAIYSDDGGAPDALVVGTAPHTLVPGVQDIPVVATPVAAGDYWIMAVYDTVASVAYTNDELQPPYAYRELGFDDPLPAEFGPAVIEDTQSFSYFVKVIQ